MSPAQERVALLIAAELEVGVDEKCGLRSIFVDLHRVVDDEIHWLQRIDQPCVPAQSGKSVAHGGEINYGWNSGEILEQHASGAERYFFFDVPLHVPAGERADIVGLDELAVFVSDQVFEKDLEAEGESIRIPAGELGE